MANLFEKILRVGEGRVLKRLKRIAADVERLEDSYREEDDATLKESTAEFKARLEKGESLDDLMPEAFAAVREAARRTLGMRAYPVQLMGGAALHLGNIAEMKTGEGKTLVATFPAYLNALTGKGVHIVTVNDYLAKYQSELMGRVFRALGMSTGVILAGQTPAERREQYAADITYGTNNEFGFDYLRDNMAQSVEEMVQRGHHFAIVDEVDSILIDEARTPLIISGPASGDVNRWYTEFAAIAKRMKPGRDYEVDEKKRTVGVLEAGIDRVEDELGIDNLYESVNTPLISFLNNAIRAKALYARDKDYVVMNGEVMIVDEHTGRLLPGRRYNEGMHQAIEAKEGVQIKAENQTLATITLQNFFRLYDKLSGMTGTAETEASEFWSTYKIGVVPIPTNKPMVRVDENDRIYKSEKIKFEKVADEIQERHEAGQPVLVGTTSVGKSELLSRLLTKRGVKHEVLNAKHHEQEAGIIAEAGRKGAVTVATNMAGRGTDIMLGGNVEFLATKRMADDYGLDANEHPEEYEAKWDEVYEAVKAEVEAEAEEVREAGGLAVIGTERHDSRRIDNQLRGRSGRQGDPGVSRFYLSLEDDLLVRMVGTRLQSLANSTGLPDDEYIEMKLITNQIRSAQSQVEGRNAEMRKNVLKYDDVLNRQRKTIYADRRTILEGDDLKERVERFIKDVVSGVLDDRLGRDSGGDSWDFDRLWADLGEIYPMTITIDEVIEEAGTKGAVTRDFIEQEVLSDALVSYRTREEAFGADTMREIERHVVLGVIDRKWREHLYEMDYLKEGIGLRAMAQRDPLVEYQREGFEMFQSMTEQIREEAVRYLFHVEPKPNETEAELVAELDAPKPQRLSYTAAGEDGEIEVRDERGEVNSQATKKAQREAALEAARAEAERRAESGEVSADEVAEIDEAAARASAEGVPLAVQRQQAERGRGAFGQAVVEQTGGTKSAPRGGGKTGAGKGSSGKKSQGGKGKRKK